MLITSIYTMCFSSSAIFAKSNISSDALFFWGGKNIILLSGLWISVDVKFSMFFYIKNKLN